MAFTRKTLKLGLPQWGEKDKPTFMGDMNGAFDAIDKQFRELDNRIAEQQEQINTLQNGRGA